MKKSIRTIALVLFVLTLFFLPGPAGAADSTLKIALVHFNAVYKEPAKNLDALEQLHRQAAAAGAEIIFNTELAISGYSFTSRDDVRPYTLTMDSPSLKRVAALAKELGVYIGITFPEQDPATDIFYNAAAVYSPKGQLVCKYRKTWGEIRWARSGGPNQKGVFSTPWGNIGIAICADSYFSLIPRTLALKGADLIWVPANWPPGGTMPPEDVWQTRAQENGVYIAACNRTGMDRVMDLSQAVSTVVKPDGTPMFIKRSDDSTLLFAEIPLDPGGKLDRGPRLKKMAERNVDNYRPLYLEPWTDDLTRYYKLPEPGKLSLRVMTASSQQLDMAAIEQQVADASSSLPTLWLLPQMTAKVLDTARLQVLAEKKNCAFAVSVIEKNNAPSFLLISRTGSSSFQAKTGEVPYQLLHFGPACVAMVPMADLRLPETAVVLAKLGCDLVLISEKALPYADMRFASVRSIDNVAVAAAGNNRAIIAHLPVVHGQVTLKKAEKGALCALELDTHETRSKKFYDRVDFDLLLAK